MGNTGVPPPLSGNDIHSVRYKVLVRARRLTIQQFRLRWKATKMATYMRLMWLVMVGVLATLVSHADSRSPIAPAFGGCKYFCNVGGGRYECCDDGYPIDERCHDPDKVYVNAHYCPPGLVCIAIFEYKKCGTVKERCSGNEFCCPVDTEEADFACASLRRDRVPLL
ncbi:uncharacterized protein LOC143028578 isoform X2 [Oratosquilla oratoria]|uniref:uncharacterized protein LOC143028578 isoform X2 n=1 Tax=Oratosquilla oratoria TaxID=337810 RepID=UPI003F75B822